MIAPDDEEKVQTLAGAVEAYGVTVQHYTKAELTSAPIVICTAPGTKSHGGTVAGIGILDATMLSLGGGTAGPTSTLPNFVLTAVADGANDLIGWRRSFITPGTGDRGFLRRDVNLASGASLGTIDFNGAESHMSFPAPVNLTNGGGGTTTMTMLFASGAACRVSPLYSGLFAGTIQGFPLAAHRATDHYVLSIAQGTLTEARMVQESFKTFGARSLTFGPNLAPPSVTNLGGAYKRVRASLTIPAEYNASVIFSYSYGGVFARSVTITASRAAMTTALAMAPEGVPLAGAAGWAAVLELPDFSGVAGWDNAWAPPSALNVDWSVTGAGTTLSGPTICQDGGKTFSATRMGNIN